MRIYDIIQKKRDGYELSFDEIEFFVSGAVKNEIPDYQISALLMAVCIRGMTVKETNALTMCMAKSGDMLDLTEFSNLSADKHSTGGVGDKTTLVVAPAVASMGMKVAKMSGRGLGHTGGTIDKLESIKGYRTDLTPLEMKKQVEKIGIAVTGACANLDPADKKFYAIRDVTATVESIPLIVSSIMSKKLAGGSKSIVLDVKTGSGSFMHDREKAYELASLMVRIGRENGRNVSALITNMDRPLGHAIGNSLEIKEAVSVLMGKEEGSDLHKVCVALTAQLARMSLCYSEEKSVYEAEDAILSGRAYRKFEEWIRTQGGDFDSIFEEDFSNDDFSFDILSDRNGYIKKTNAEEIGKSAMLLGAGRAKKEDSIDYKAGIVTKTEQGQKIKKGDVIATMYAKDESLFKAAEEKYLSSLEFSDEKPDPEPVIIDRITE